MDKLYVVVVHSLISSCVCVCVDVYECNVQVHPSVSVYVGYLPECVSRPTPMVPLIAWRHSIFPQAHNLNFIGIVLCTFVHDRNGCRRICGWRCRWAWAWNIAIQHTTTALFPNGVLSNSSAHRCRQAVRPRRPTNAPHSQLDRAYRSHADTPTGQDPLRKISKTRTIEQLRTPFRSNSAKVNR